MAGSAISFAKTRRGKIFTNAARSLVARMDSEQDTSYTTRITVTKGKEPVEAARIVKSSKAGNVRLSKNARTARDLNSTNARERKSNLAARMESEQAGSSTTQTTATKENTAPRVAKTARS